MASQPQAAKLSIPSSSNPTETQQAMASPVESRPPTFPLGRSHLPTPQSPDNMGQYLNLQGPESPLAQISQLNRPVLYSGPPSQKPMQGQPQQQTMTPESSPYTPRHDPSRYPMPHAIPHFNPYSHYLTTPKASSSTAPSTIVRPPPRMATPPPSNAHPANLSSPFADKLTITPRPLHFPRPTSAQIPVHIDDIFTASASPPKSNTPSAQTSTPPVSPPPSSQPSASASASAGGEMERIRQTMLQNQMTHHQEAEARRPEYLKRGKRPLSEVGPSTTPEEESSRRSGVGIMDSPHKGRRIALFQETSDESFEESLMAGGYGRYRTADWVRQPHPLPAPSATPTPTPGPPGPSSIIQRVEALQAQRPPSAKEMTRFKRLNAFRPNETTNTNTEPQPPKLFPVTVQGIGRVLMDAESEERGLGEVKGGKKGPATNGKKAAAAAKKKSQEPSARERRAALMAAALEEAAEKPNWPDAEFPWKLRSEERAELTKEEERHRMKRIESFFSRDTDEEGGSDDEQKPEKDDDEELLTSAEWGRVYRDHQRPTPARRGRGKMVSLAADVSTEGRPQTFGGSRRNMFFPTDPGDARAALLAKRTVRAISFRKDRRHETDDEVVLCICKGKYDSDDGDVVQCDQCRTWYHLHCIGIPNVAALGPEDAEWFCMACIVVDRSDSSDEEEEVVQPTFAPTDNEPSHKSPDAPLYQPLQDSPAAWTVPQTPPRRSRLASGFSSDSREAPITPKGPATPHYLRPARLFGNSTPLFDHYYASGEDAPFDPTSTPSRGIKFGAALAFTTPKGAQASPSRRRDSSSRLFGAPGTLDEALRGDGETRLRLATPSEREGFWTRHLRRLSAEGHAGVWASP
ncbi:PHD-type domain-containing protein [Mycena indigotica]|uniref:PHD-type domain-containing protein n=1 Tax=Mycena indigotica TaxID=2126181 RepID=A0A8H6SVR7_9AGAR|nr:PHD-type domain-containing protein [Mycena indigotica]KAF7306274.1 PHD-type domain-containing protein [Mycena indigotica]